MLKRQVVVCAVVAGLFASIVASLYLQERRREWALRVQQAEHRLDVAFELISRELARVRADALFLANQRIVRDFASTGSSQLRGSLESEYENFVRHKQTYDQIRLLNMDGHEIIRVNYERGDASVIPQAELQDKEDRYYYKESLSLQPDDVFVSDFDLNLEHGVIERPLKPVIRFVAPVLDDTGANRGLLVLNYLGARLLAELESLSLPGSTVLLKTDGNYVLSPNAEDSWGWLLEHDRSFDRQFPIAWQQVMTKTGACLLTNEGAFAARQIALGEVASTSQNVDALTADQHDSILIVSYLPRTQVFSASAKLLRRLLVLAAAMMLPLAILARYWAHASVGRKLQAHRVAKSEERLRDLSSRLLRIQEEERRAISREIHDELGQQVTAISLDLKLADRNIDNESVKPHLARAIAENEQLLETLHAFAKRVRPAVLDDLGLRDAVESHLWDFENRTGIEVAAKLHFESSKLPAVVAENAFRLLQESLNNVAKHADADHVSVDMSMDQYDVDPHFRMTVADNGRGCGPDDWDGSRLGLVGMQERVDLLAGSLCIISQEEKGTRIEVAIPLPATDTSDIRTVGENACPCELLLPWFWRTITLWFVKR